jgi:endonuclease YncB( thermonuclease family)
MDENELLIEELKKLTLKNVETFSLNGLNTYCKVLRIHDPDTFTVALKIGNEYYKYNIRLNGIDAPELHSKIKKESLVCKIGTEYISSKILNEVIFIKCYSFDKYGRLLADLYINENDSQSINQLLVDCKFVRVYGEDNNLHKFKWTDSELDMAISNGVNADIITMDDVNLYLNDESNKEQKKFRKIKIEL